MPLKAAFPRLGHRKTSPTTCALPLRCCRRLVGLTCSGGATGDRASAPRLPPALPLRGCLCRRGGVTFAGEDSGATAALVETGPVLTLRGAGRCDGVAVEPSVVDIGPVLALRGAGRVVDGVSFFGDRDVDVDVVVLDTGPVLALRGAGRADLVTF